MTDAFNAPAQYGLSPAEKLLISQRVAYRKKPGGILEARGNIDISGQNLTELPDMSMVQLNGDFNCAGNNLTSLKGAPRHVGGSFSCAGNELPSLEFGPQTVGRDYDCSDNQLPTLAFVPAMVPGTFNCLGNLLSTLDDAPKGFTLLKSDFGDFTGGIGAAQYQPGTDPAREDQRRAAIERAGEAAVVLQSAVKPLKPLRLGAPA